MGLPHGLFVCVRGVGTFCRKGDLSLTQVVRKKHKFILISLTLCKYVILSVHYTNLVKILYFACIGLFCKIFEVNVEHLQL